MDSVKWFISHFPESMFLCSQTHAKSYAGGVIRGKKIAQRSNVLMCGIARNCEKILPYTIARIERLGELFNSYGVYIFENDSVDKTLDILQTWHSQTPNICIEHKNLNPPPFTDSKGLIRRRFMAIARNKYLEYARFVCMHSKVDYIIVVDMDLLGGWSYHGVLNSLGQSSSWDIIGSNSLIYQNEQDHWGKLFYDSWAFRTLGNPDALEDDTANRLIFNRGESMVQVNSCFGGLAIYKPHFLSEGLNYNETDCDHPSLHNQLIKLGYVIYLNPSQITLYNKSQYVI